MLKHKSMRTLLPLDGGKLKLEEVKIEPVSDLVAEMQAANAEAVAALNRPREPKRYPCNINCGCGPCRSGNCGNCEWERSNRSYGDMFREQSYRKPSRSDNATSLPEGVAREWVQYGGIWDTWRNTPVLRNSDEKYRWDSFMQNFERYKQRAERQAEYEYRMRHLNDSQQIYYDGKRSWTAFLDDLVLPEKK
jgi:hypothetical protein